MLADGVSSFQKVINHDSSSRKSIVCYVHLLQVNPPHSSRVMTFYDICYTSDLELYPFSASPLPEVFCGAFLIRIRMFEGEAIVCSTE